MLPSLTWYISMVKRHFVKKKCYDVIYEALHTLLCAVICFEFIQSLFELPKSN